MAEIKDAVCAAPPAALPQQKRLARVCLPVTATAVLLCVLLNGAITDETNRSDARQNLQAAWNLYAWGVFSKNNASDEKPAPGNYREPLPPFVTALYMYLLGEGRVCKNGDCGRHGFNHRIIKKINLVWAFLVLCASGALAYRLTGSGLCSLTVLVLVYSCFLRNPATINTLYTEIPASACMLACALCLTFFVRKPSFWISFATGIVLGALVLTKAIFFYAVPLLALAAAGAAALNGNISSEGNPRRGIVCLFLGLLVVTGPWLVRNGVYFGNLQISSRGGLALYTRALINQMAAFEYHAAFHCWGPGAYRRIVRGTPLDVDVADYARDGRAVRLSCSPEPGCVGDDAVVRQQDMPGQTVSFYAIARAQRVRMQLYFKQAGCRHIDRAADMYLRDEALGMIFCHPLRHVAATLPLAWRGMWCFYGGGFWTVLGAVSYAAFVWVCLWAVVRRNGDVIAFVTVPFMLLLLYAFFTNNLPRFNTPAIPFMLIALVFAGQCILRRFRIFVQQRGQH